MSSLDERAAPFRRRMVEELPRLGVSDEVVLRAMATVPRHRFLDHFWATPPDLSWKPANVREFTVDEDAADDALAFMYDPNIALATRGPIDRAAATSSVSAPVVVASMLAELDLRPGLRVLEIGAGSGYHAALMAEMVGRSELITTLDIDETLITETVDRLERLGYGAMTVRCVDGALGAPDQAPFDRIVATVGCSDLSSAWIEQLAPGGRMLVPLEHGHLHPRVLVEKGDEVAGRFTGYSGFIPMEGAQRGKWIWAEPPEPSRRKSTTVELPGKVRAAVTPGNSRRPNLTRGLWNFATYLALRDRRAAGTALVIGSSFAMVHDGQVVFGGADGQALMARLLEIAADWLGLGTPGLSRYTMTFSPLSLPSPGRIEDSRSGPWHIERVDHRQTVVLSPAG